MTIRSRFAAPVLALSLALSGCYGSSEDKGDNGDQKIVTPKPSLVEDANTAGTRKTVLPEPGKPDVKAGERSGAIPR